MISGTAGGPVRRAGPARGAAAWGWCAVAPGGVWEARARRQGGGARRRCGVVSFFLTLEGGLFGPLCGDRLALGEDRLTL